MRIWIGVILCIFVLNFSSYSQKHYIISNENGSKDLSISKNNWENLNTLFDKSKQKYLSKQTDSIIISISNIRLKICVLYNSAGKISEIAFYQLENDNWLHFQKIEHTYDSLNRIIRKLNLSWTGKWENFLLDEYQYNVGDTLESCIGYYWKENSWDFSYRYIKTFDLSWNITTIIREIYENGFWRFSTKSSYQLAQDKLSQTHLSESWNGNSWEYSSLQTATYDNKQRMLSVLLQKWNGNSFEDFAKLDINYTDNFEETQVIRLFLNNEWMNYESSYYKRDSEGWLLNAKYKMWVDNNRWIDSDGPLSIINPDGLEVHYISREINGFYSNPLAVNTQNNSKINNFELLQNYPNPFNPTTTINYQINEKGFVNLKVYDIIGKEVAILVNETQNSGKYSVSFNASNLPSGVYIYSLRVNNFIKNNKMTLVK